MIHWNIPCVLIFLCVHLSFPKFFPLQPHSHLPPLNFSVFFIENTALWSMYCPKLVIHSNQAPNVASSVGYIISCMSRPFCKVLCSCTSTQNAKNIHIKCFPRVNFASLALDKLKNSIPLGYVNKIMTESIS